MINRPLFLWPIIYFQNIQSKVSLYSPSTIGGNNFVKLAIGIASMLYHVIPGIWEKAFIEELEEWLVENNKSGECDPFISVACVTGKKE